MPEEAELWDRFYDRLTRQEFYWLNEPAELAQSLVPCPHVNRLDCACRGVDREERGFESFPHLREQFEGRLQVLIDREEEIMARSVAGRGRLAQQ